MSTATFHCSRRFLLDIQNKTTTLKRVAIIWAASSVGWESKATSGHQHNPLSPIAAAPTDCQWTTTNTEKFQGTKVGLLKQITFVVQPKDFWHHFLSLF